MVDFLGRLHFSLHHTRHDAGGFCFQHGVADFVGYRDSRHGMARFIHFLDHPAAGDGVADIDWIRVVQRHAQSHPANLPTNLVDRRGRQTMGNRCFEMKDLGVACIKMNRAVVPGKLRKESNILFGKAPGDREAIAHLQSLGSAMSETDH